MTSTVADSISWVTSLIGTYFLSIAVGPNPGGIFGGATTSLKGRFYIAYQFPKRWWWGWGFIGVAFLFQLLKILGVIRGPGCI
jgi:hypothetical protein